MASQVHVVPLGTNMERPSRTERGAVVLLPPVSVELRNQKSCVAIFRSSTVSWGIVCLAFGPLMRASRALCSHSTVPLY